MAKGKAREVRGCELEKIEKLRESGARMEEDRNETNKVYNKASPLNSAQALEEEMIYESGKARREKREKKKKSQSKMYPLDTLPTHLEKSGASSVRSMVCRGTAHGNTREQQGTEEISDESCRIGKKRAMKRR